MILHEDATIEGGSDASNRTVDSSSSDGPSAAIDSGIPPIDSGLPPIDADLSATITCPGPGSPVSNYTGCGSERWPIKTGTDSQAAGIHLIPHLNTIAALVALPAAGGGTSRETPTETTMWELKDVTLTELKEESDSDYHLVVSDGTKTMIAEVPNPRCGTGSPWLCFYSRTRSNIDAKYTVTSTPTYPAATVTLRGVGFFDYLHGQNGVAPNAIELHPTLQLCFGHGCVPS